VIESDAGVADNPEEVVVLQYTNPDGVICRVVQIGANPQMRRIDRWFPGNPKDRVGKWIQWLQSSQAGEVLFHRAEKDAAIAERDQAKRDHDNLKAAHDVLFVERESLKTEVATLKAEIVNLKKKP